MEILAEEGEKNPVYQVIHNEIKNASKKLQAEFFTTMSKTHNNFTLLLHGPNLINDYFTGQIIRGAILKLIANHDQKLADKLHEGNKVRPYSVSTIMGEKNRLNRTRRGEIIVKEGSMFKFRMGILSSDLAERMIKITLQKSEMKVQLADGVFKISSFEIKRKNVKELLNIDKQPPTNLELSFITPTYFNISRQEFPLRFPDPRYLFMNLATLWNSFIEEKILVDQEELFSWLENHISINYYNLSTHSVYIAKNTPKIGFKGKVCYQLSGEQSYQRWVHALAQFAEFSNVGANRTAGLGCVRYNPKI